MKLANLIWWSPPPLLLDLALEGDEAIALAFDVLEPLGRKLGEEASALGAEWVVDVRPG